MQALYSSSPEYFCSCAGLRRCICPTFCCRYSRYLAASTNPPCLLPARRTPLHLKYLGKRIQESEFENVIFLKGIRFKKTVQSNVAYSSPFATMMPSRSSRRRSSARSRQDFLSPRTGLCWTKGNQWPQSSGGACIASQLAPRVLQQQGSQAPSSPPGMIRLVVAPVALRRTAS
jgi:hypothetical protein